MKLVQSVENFLTFNAENQRQEKDIPVVGQSVTHIDLDFKLTYDTGAGATANEDAISRFIKTVKIVDRDGKDIFKIIDSRLLKYWNLFKYREVIETPVDTATGTGKTAEIIYRIHLGKNPKDKFDASGGIPIEKKPRVVIEIGSSADLGSAQTFSSMSIDATFYYIDTPAESPYELVSTNKPIDRVASDLDLEVDLTKGYTYIDFMIMVLNSAGNRSDADVKELGIKNKREKKEIYRNLWYLNRVDDRIQHLLKDTPVGVTMVDGDIDHEPFYVEEEGQYALGFTTTTTGGQIFVLMYRTTEKGEEVLQG